MLKCGCCTASYNDHTTDITKDEDQKEEEIIDTYATLPPPHLRIQKHNFGK